MSRFYVGQQVLSEAANFKHAFLLNEEFVCTSEPTDNDSSPVEDIGFHKLEILSIGQGVVRTVSMCPEGLDKVRRLSFGNGYSQNSQSAAPIDIGIFGGSDVGYQMTAAVTGPAQRWINQNLQSGSSSAWNLNITGMIRQIMHQLSPDASGRARPLLAEEFEGKAYPVIVLDYPTQINQRGISLAPPGYQRISEFDRVSDVELISFNLQNYQDVFPVLAGLAAINTLVLTQNS